MNIIPFLSYEANKIRIFFRGFLDYFCRDGFCWLRRVFGEILLQLMLQHSRTAWILVNFSACHISFFRLWTYILDVYKKLSLREILKKRLLRILFSLNNILDPVCNKIPNRYQLKPLTEEDINQIKFHTSDNLSFAALSLITYPFEGTSWGESLKIHKEFSE